MEVKYADLFSPEGSQSRELTTLTVVKARPREVRSLQLKGLLTRQRWLCYGTNHTAQI